MNNDARMLVLAATQIRRTTLQGVAPGRDGGGPVEERETAPYPCAVPVHIDEDDEVTGVYQIGARKALPFECDVPAEKHRV